jgi:hypothetical protein
MKLALTFISVLVAAHFAVPAQAQDNGLLLCAKDGKILVRPKCKKKKGEVQVDVAGLQSLIPAGAKGEQGIQGMQGEQGQSAFDLMPSGASIFGVIGNTVPVSQLDQTLLAYASFPALLSQDLRGSDIYIKINSAVDNDCQSGQCPSTPYNATSSLCTGTPAAPTAPAGKVCIYPRFVTNGRSSSFNATPVGDSDFNGAFGRHGFRLSLDAAGAGGGEMGFEAVWAYTAP